jgi:hypothetical protein
MESEGGSIQQTLSSLAENGADSDRIANTAVHILQSVDAALSPIISQRGVAALYKRSLYLIRSDLPWLKTVYEGALVPGDFMPLHAALSAQTAADALAGTSALLTTFHGLLVSLIGDSLTERLLRSIWDTPSSGDAVQDSSP